MFVDASAIVAILTRESDADDLADRLQQAIEPITSAIAIFEATLGICRKRHASIQEAQADIADFLDIARIKLVPVTGADADIGLDAFSRYGKGQRHPAQLNMGDCFAYAVTRNHRTSLLCKGNDFASTDITLG